jgi:hypothetical protein
MHIPKSKLERFVRQLIEQCLVSQEERINRGLVYKNYFLLGAEQAKNAALYNKIWCYIDDLESLLYSPVSLKFNISAPNSPSLLNQAKGRSASSDMRVRTRTSNTDTTISEAVCWSLVKGKSFVKMQYKRGEFSPDLIQPELFGVFNENRTRLDEDMEAFVHSVYITQYQFNRLIWNHPDREALMKKARRYTKPGRDGAMSGADGAMKQVIVGGMYPYQPASQQTNQGARGIVDWMGGPSPILSPAVLDRMMRLDELWVWDDERQDWTTFQMVGDDMLIMGKYRLINSFAYNTESKESEPGLKGHHPFVEFCPNRLDGYFWGRSEIVNIAMLQEAVNSRINGINMMLRRQEDPSYKFTGSTGVNQNALARFKKPGGYFSDSSPNAKIEAEEPQISADLWNSLHEYERMFDEMAGTPPIAKGRGEPGVRGQGHAETLIRMFSPRFKDRALLVERDVESLGGLMLDLARAHIDRNLIAWVPAAAAGIEADPEASEDPFLEAPAPGLVPVKFQYGDLPDDMSLTVDSHSGSPAFAAEARALAFDLFKIGAMSPEEVVEHTDAPEPEQLIASIERKRAQEVAFLAAHPEAAGKGGGKKKAA